MIVSIGWRIVLPMDEPTNPAKALARVYTFLLCNDSFSVNSLALGSDIIFFILNYDDTI